MNKTEINSELYELLRRCADSTGLPVMNKSLFFSTTEKYGKELFRSTLAEYITREKPPYPLKQFSESKVIKNFRKLEKAKFTDYIYIPTKEVIEKYDVHIHVPEGATPKDGPSAGITMLTSLVSSFTQRKVKNKLAMTGEITLRGKVLPVGGIKEKILAAKRAGVKEIIMSKSNRKDVEDIKSEYIKDLKIHYVDKMNEVIDLAVLKSKVKEPIHFELK